tara:strand:- start:10135 stop:10287 length:153 start_codon:yes stop_codon:yes gene_type:complete
MVKDGHSIVLCQLIDPLLIVAAEALRIKGVGVVEDELAGHSAIVGYTAEA